MATGQLVDAADVISLNPWELIPASALFFLRRRMITWDLFS